MVIVSTHTPRAGRDNVGRACLLRKDVSTHTPRAGRDVGRRADASTLVVSTHTPRAGRDEYYDRKKGKWTKFQPTRPVRGVTAKAPRLQGPISRFNPHAPCGA